MNNRCPKCNEKLSRFYLKENCPKCNVNMQYYKFDERLEQDAINAKKEIESVNKFVSMLKKSTIGSAWNIIRLILFFTPLASMCLPMFWAGSKKVSLITVIMHIVNHGFDLSAIVSDKSYFFAILSMVLIIVLSLVEIINSLFSSTKKGFRRDIVFSLINTVVFGAISILVVLFDGKALVGFYVTMLIYLAEFVLHFVVATPKTKKRKIATTFSTFICVILAISICIISPYNADTTYAFEKADGEITVVTFNLACAFGTSFEGLDSLDRCSKFADYMNAIQPDMIGTQEINSYWLEELSTTMSDYDSYGVKRGGDSEEKNSEMNAVFWLKDKYTALETNTFWLSQTPDVESRYSYVNDEGETVETTCYRICSYVVLQNNETDEIYIHLNTHLDNSTASAGNFGASLILDKIEELKETYTDANVILTGDFNQSSSDEACQMMSEVLNISGDDSIGVTYQEWGYASTGDVPIDFIFSSGNSVEDVKLDDLSNGYISDHFGRLTTINF